MTLPHGTFYVLLHDGPENAAAFTFQPPANRLIRALHVTSGRGGVSLYRLATMRGLWLEYRYAGAVSMKSLLMDDESNINLTNRELLHPARPAAGALTP